jgi:hypothetical protein
LYDHALTNPDAAGQARRMQVASSRVHPRSVTMQQPPPVAPFRSTRKHAALSSALQEGHSVKRMWKNVHSGHRKRNQTHRGGHMTERPYSDLYLKSYADAQRVQARVNYSLPVKKFKSNSSTKYK